MNTFEISYVIQDGENEYAKSFIYKSASARLDGKTAAGLIADDWTGTPRDKRRFVRELLQEGFGMIPQDYRGIKEIGWRQVMPIIVTIRENLVVSVAHLPADTVLEVHDWDCGEPDARGEYVPAVRVWQ